MTLLRFRPHPWLLPALILLCVWWMYRQATGFEYVWDDRIFFVTSTDLRQGDILKAITEPVLSGTSYFRPLVMAWFVAEIRLLGVDPYWSHLTNILIHLTNTLLVGLISLRLQPELLPDTRRRNWVPVVAMLLYGLHPGLIESVAWVSGRFDAAVTTFSLLTIYFSLSASRASIAWAAFFFLCAACSKEMAMSVPAVALLCRWAANDPGRSIIPQVKSWWRGPTHERLLVISLVLAGMVYLALRVFFLERIVHTDALMKEIFGTAWKHTGLVGLTLLFYFKTVCWPFTDSGPLHPYDPFQLSQLDLASGVATVVVSLLFLGWTLFRPSRFRLVLLAALLTLGPVANIIPLTIVGNIGHERFLVLPLSIGSLAISTIDSSAWTLSPSMRRWLQPGMWGALLVWSLVCLINLQVTVPLWKNQLTLWTWAYKKNPDYVYAQFLLASAAIEVQRYDVAKEVLEKAEKQGPVPLRLSVPYGQYLMRTGKAEEGIEKIEAALKGEFQPHIGLQERGLPLEENRISRQEFYGWLLVYAYTALAEAKTSKRRFAEAVKDADIALFYQDDNPVATMTRSFALYGMGRWDDAEAGFKRAQTLVIPSLRGQFVKLRVSFLEQLCAGPEKSNQTCQKFVSEQSATKAIK